jgi:hypothetical protein
LHHFSSSRDYVRRPRQRQNSDLHFSDAVGGSTSSSSSSSSSDSKSKNGDGQDGSASEQVPVKLAFPGNDFDRTPRQVSTGTWMQKGNNYYKDLVISIYDGQTMKEQDTFNAFLEKERVDNYIISAVRQRGEIDL